MQKGGHRLLGVEHRLVHVHVDQLRAVLDLLARHGEAFLVAAGEDHAGEGAGTRDVGPLTHVDEEGIVADVQRLQAREPQFLLGGGWPPRGKVAHRPSDGADVIGRGAAAAADDVQEAALCEFPQQAGGVFRGFVVPGLRQRVRQSRIGVATDERVGDVRELLDVGTHEFRAQRAVQAYRDRACVAQGIPEGFRSLAGERAPGLVGDGARYDDREPPSALLEQRLDREDRRLGVERVEDGLEQDQVGSAVGETREGLAVGCH